MIVANNVAIWLRACGRDGRDGRAPDAGGSWRRTTTDLFVPEELRIRLGRITRDQHGRLLIGRIIKRC
jgi:hypothetical protein